MSFYRPERGFLFWGDEDIGAAANTRFLDPGFNTLALAGLNDDRQIPVPGGGTLKNFGVRHNTAVGNGNNVVYTLFVNGVATALTVTVPTGAIGQVTDAVNVLFVPAGSRLSVQVTKAAIIVNGMLHVLASVEIV